MCIILAYNLFIVSLCKCLQLPSVALFLYTEGIASKMTALCNNSSSVFGHFPNLIIDQNDVAGSWRIFSDEFMIALEMQDIDLGDKVNPRMRTLALLKAIGCEGRDYLRSVGFNLKQGEFEKAFNLLDEHYARRENIFVRTQKFVSVSQRTGEDDRDYLVRVERLSREAELGNVETIRRQLAMVLAVNGLRDVALRKELMALCDLDWDTLKRILKTRSVAQHAADVLAKSCGGAFSVEQKVSEVRKHKRTKSVSFQNKACGSNDNVHKSSSHAENYKSRSVDDCYANIQHKP